MQRRDLIRMLAATALLPWVPRDAEAALAFGQRAHRDSLRSDLEALTSAEAELVTTIAELIIPRTDTPGASDVGVTPFIDHLLAHWFEKQERDEFIAGLYRLEARAETGFVQLAPERQMALLTALDGIKGAPGSAEATFAAIKSLTVFGYFTSEVVVKQVLKAPVVPGRFDGCAAI